MINMYIDESGSVHPTSEKLNRYFIIGIVIPTDSKKLKRVYKTFIRNNIDDLKKLDVDGKMFDRNGHFIELKGSSMNKTMKLKFIEFFCQNNLFEVRYIILDNNQLEEKFIKNKARTFNYLTKIFLINSIKKKYIEDKEIFFADRRKKCKNRFKIFIRRLFKSRIIIK